MNIDSIKSIVNNKETDNSTKRVLIIHALALDEAVVVDVLKILESERSRKKELISEMNHELSRAHIYIDEYTESEKSAKNRFNKTFITDQIARFYLKFQDQVTHCYNRFIK